MIDVQTDEGFSKIRWVSPPPDLKGKQWTCHEILHDGDGPLECPDAVRGRPYQSLITPAEAAETAARSLVDCEAPEVIKIAVHIGGYEYARYAVTVKMEATFETREI